MKDDSKILALAVGRFIAVLMPQAVTRLTNLLFAWGCTNAIALADRKCDGGGLPKFVRNRSDKAQLNTSQRIIAVAQLGC